MKTKDPLETVIDGLYKASRAEAGLGPEVDETTRQLRELSRTKNRTLSQVCIKMAVERAMKKAESGVITQGELNKFKRGLAASEEVEKPITKDEPMIAAPAAHQSSESVDTNPPDLAQVYDLANEVKAPETNGAHSETTTQTPMVSEIQTPKRKYKQRVFWSAAERLKVCTLAAQKLRADGVGFMPEYGDRNGSKMLLQAMESAQCEILQPERRKVLQQRFHLEQAHLIEDLKHALRESHKPRLILPEKPEVKVEPPPPPAPPAPIIPPAPYVNGTSVPAMSEEEKADPILGAANALMLALRVQFVRTKEIVDMNSLLVEEVDGLRKRVEASERRMDAMEKVERKEVAAEKAKLPSCAVLGCHKDEFAHIKMKAEEARLQVELRFYDQDTSPRPVSTDWAIAMKFINHGWNDHLKACMTRGQYQFVRGGITNMMRQLELWFGAATA